MRRRGNRWSYMIDVGYDAATGKRPTLQIETCYARLMASGGQRGRQLAAKTMRNVHIVLHRALSDAERLGLVTRNAAHAAKAPIAQRADMVTWTSGGYRWRKP